MSSRTRHKKRDTPDPEQEWLQEPQVEIRLSSTSAQPDTRVLYHFQQRQYVSLPAGDYLIHLLTLPSRTIHREDLELQMMQTTPEVKDEGATVRGQQQQQLEQQQQQPEDVAQMLEELYGSVMSPEQLAKLDSQPNPFNFSDRVSQTFRIPSKEVAQQTDQPPSSTFGVTVGLSVVYDAYQRDYCLLLARERQRQLQQEKEEDQEKKSGKKNEENKEKSTKANKDGKNVPKKQSSKGPAGPGRGGGGGPPQPPQPPQGGSGPGQERGSGADQFLTVTRTVERIVNQNIFDDIIHDYRYWEDTSDDFRPLEGSLLPLWKLSGSRTRDLLVADVCWSPTYPDLLAAAYTPGNNRDSEASGLLCLYTLKNPGIPERCLPTPCGLTSVQFHPTRESLLVAGRSDGAVTVFDTRLARSPGVLASTTSTGKHLFPVSQVRWVPTEPGQSLSFYSVAEDGRVSEWMVRPSSLEVRDVLDFQARGKQSRSPETAAKPPLEGTATCVALKPDDRSVLLVGVDTGVVLEMTLSSTTHGLIRYYAHTAPVRAIVWNGHHRQVFATCSVDWMLKIWLQHQRCALVTLDLGAPVAGLTWCHYSSSVIVGVTEDGRVHVYDLFLHKCRPLCVQNLLQRRRSSLACVALNPFHPVLLVGGDRGYLVTFKLSPNLRRPHKDAKGADEQKLREIELAKMERVIATARV